MQCKVLTTFSKRLPNALGQVAVEGETYYRYGVMLKKVANFYNNMAAQVNASLVCHHPKTSTAKEEIILVRNPNRKRHAGTQEVVVSPLPFPSTNLPVYFRLCIPNPMRHTQRASGDAFLYGMEAVMNNNLRIQERTLRNT